jgi:hypothetical protein
MYSMNNKICIHKYLTRCKTADLPPGFGDFLRGTVTLLILSKRYNYAFFVDKSIHPVFSYFKDSSYYIHNGNMDDTVELLPSCGSPWENVYRDVVNLFETNNSFSIITNCFYTINHAGFLENFGKIPDDIQLIMRDILQPNDVIEAKIDELFKTVYRIDQNEKYKVVHLRIGDGSLIHNTLLDLEVFQNYYHKITNYMYTHEEANYILITDSIQMGKLLSAHIPKLLYWDNNKIHIGDLKINMDNDNIDIDNKLLGHFFRRDNENEEQSTELFDTVVDFAILSRCSEIISNGSGFSLISSCIYNIKYTLIKKE